MYLCISILLLPPLLPWGVDISVFGSQNLKGFKDQCNRGNWCCAEYIITDCPEDFTSLEVQRAPGPEQMETRNTSNRSCGIAEKNERQRVIMMERMSLSTTYRITNKI